MANNQGFSGDLKITTVEAHQKLKADDMAFIGAHDTVEIPNNSMQHPNFTFVEMCAA
jgi:hypothetical protein